MTYQLVRNLVAPRKLTEFTFKELVAKAKAHFCPQPSEIVHRFKFHTRVQQEDESAACRIPSGAQTAVRTLWVLGYPRGYATGQNSLLSQGHPSPKTSLCRTGLKFGKAFELCQASELAVKHAHTLHAGHKQEETPAAVIWPYSNLRECRRLTSKFGD